MKKIITLIAALFMFIGIAAAQSVEHGKLFHNTYVGIDGGIITPMIPSQGTSYFSTIAPTAGIEFGKNITPVIGLSLEGQAYPLFTDNKLNINKTNVVGNLKINLSNWIGGYKGQPRLVEVVLVPGIGWMHDYNVSPRDPNYITYNTGCEVNFNLGKNRAWQINVNPTVVWNKYDGTGMGFYGKDADMRLTAGLTYKFGYRNLEGERTHNFTVCNNGVSIEEYEDIYNKYCEALNATPDTVTVVVEKEVVVEVAAESTKPANMFVEFEKGSSVLSKFWVNTVSEIASCISDKETAVVVGSADSSTGSKEINERLANERAEAVAKVLRENGVKNIKVSSVIDIEKEPELSRCALITVE